MSIKRYIKIQSCTCLYYIVKTHDLTTLAAHLLYVYQVIELTGLNTFLYVNKGF